MKQTRIHIILIALLLLAACHRNTGSKDEGRLTPTGMAETPFILEGDYTPDTGVMYKVVVGSDTCFVVVDSICNDSLYGTYYLLVDSSDCVEPMPFIYDRHWRNKRREATVYLYKEPPFSPVDDPLYCRPTYKVSVQRNIEYGQALGYWTSMTGTENESYAEIVAEGLKNSLKRTTQSLTMDLYRPDFADSGDYRLPLVMLMHGGGFYVGDKGDSLITTLCRHFASMGYVAASINYRMGFLPTRNEISRTGYMALQDAHAAMRYLVAHADAFSIDTSLLFAGGASAGAITALNLAFMRDSDRPKAVNKRRRHDLGTIASSGNSSQATFHIKAVANMWGAVTDLDMLRNSSTAIVSFHGDADLVVPYDNGFPFSDVSTRLGQRMFDRMYGSRQIDQRARELGLRSVLFPFKDWGHSLHHNADGSWNQKNVEKIRDRTTAFFYDEIAGPSPRIVADRDNQRHFSIDDQQAGEVAWKVDGGFIVAIGSNDIYVVWNDAAPRHRLSATGINAKQFGFTDIIDIDKLQPSTADQQ